MAGVLWVGPIWGFPWIRYSRALPFWGCQESKRKENRVLRGLCRHVLGIKFANAVDFVEVRFATWVACEDGMVLSAQAKKAGPLHRGIKAGAA